MALAIHAKRKGGEAIENKQLREMVHFAPLMISTTYNRIAKPSVSRCERNPSFLLVFPLRRGPKRERAKSTADSGRAADVARVGDSEMAPQAVGIAQNGLGNGAAGCNRWAGESVRRTPYELVEEACDAIAAALRPS
jgi:hypothetical protein